MIERNKQFKILRTFLLCAVLFFSGFQGFSQDPPEPCPDGTRLCNGQCVSPRNCGPGVPPPPGLPIDFGISALIASGLLLGGYHLRKKKED
ncbi:hypothetical protein [Autumnicola edwardsiae]|uniref:Uncharacterized protein n=1 Tax=Autumnicola edwardsiae TaxID=3075594 RepID=A0ABU3CQM7_9FLAO|nr:hypothetical protein [Zunongwangia sp. F297]MDT0648653.1 hypothetical protein [Zunongwangia sp. F297]